jgi:hypothetical protein
VEARLRGVKVAYIFSTSGHTASYKLGKMILPQLEQGSHGVEVVGMFFFDDNTYVLRAGDPLGERLAEVAEEQGIMLMLCDRCAIERSLAEGEPGDCRPSGTVAGVRVGCFPDLYGALSGNPPDQVITCSCEAQGGLRARSSPLSDRLAGGHGGALDVGGLGAAEPCLGEPRARLDVAKVGGVG